MGGGAAATGSGEVIPTTWPLVGGGGLEYTSESSMDGIACAP